MTSALIFLCFFWGTAVAQQEFAARATIYDHRDFKGALSYHTMKWGQCQNLPAGENDRLSSIDTHGTCVMMWEHGGCTGASKRVGPGTGGHRYVGGNWNDKTSSLAPC